LARADLTAVRLLVVSQYFWPENFRVNDIVAEMVARGHEVTVLTGYPNYPEGRIYPDYRATPGDFRSYDGAEVIRVPIVPRGKGPIRLAINYLSFVISGSLIGPLRLRRRKFDAIFVFATSPITSALPAILLSRLKAAPVVLWVLDLWPETLSAVGAVKSPVLLALVGRLVGFIYKRTTLVLGQSKAFVANVAKYAGSSARFRYFPNWVEPLFSGDLQSVKVAEEMRPHEGAFTVVFAGNVGEAQDFPSILEAAERLRDRSDIRILIVGDGRAAEWVRSEIIRRRLGDVVFMLGRHPPERMPAFFRGAGALLVSLKREPVFGMTIPGKLQSYLAAGIPVVAMLDGAGRDVIAEAGAGVAVPPGCPEELAEKIMWLADLRQSDREAMGRRGREYADREFNRESRLSQLEQWLLSPSAG
jgi:glycosyltransferase involved in cell wall biosynthesis